MLNDLLCALRDKAIIRLGGVTKAQQEEVRAKYEQWAFEYLCGKENEVVPDGSHYFPFEDDKILVLRSRISISNAKIKSLKVAPWCRDVVCTGLRA